MNAYSILKHAHSGWAYLTVLMAIIFFLAVSFYALNKKSKDNTITKISLYTTIVFHIQLLMGIVLYFLSPHAKWVEDTLSDDTKRLYALEHPLMMFAAVIFVTVANSKIKKSETIKIPVAILSLIALACILSRIPWDVWMN
jgi:hypothetical protein